MDVPDVGVSVEHDEHAYQIWTAVLVMAEKR